MPDGALPLATLADIEAIETTPFEQRISCQSTYELLGRAAGEHGDRTAIAFLPTGGADDQAIEITYRQLFARVTQAANMFTDMGVGPGDVVSYMLPNLPQTHYVIWGGEAAGIVNAVNPMLEVGQIAEILKAAGTKILVALGPTPGSDIWDKALAARDLTPSLQTLLRIGGSAPEPCFDDLLPTYPGGHLTSGRIIKASETAAYFHTGGTTGSPKLARHTHAGEIYQAWCIGLIGNYQPGEVFLCGLPLFHVNAVIVTGLGAFMMGTTVLLAGPSGYRNPTLIRDFWKIVEKYRVATFSGVPTLYAALVEVPIDGADLSSLRVAVCGAAPMPVALFNKFEDVTGVRIREGYGLTEGTCVSAVNPRDGEKRIGSIGLRVPYQQMKTVHLDDDGAYAGDCETDDIGVIVIKGPNTTPGYKQEEYNRGLFVGDGWLNTGDLGRRDADGYFWLTGRAKDLIIRGGHNIDPGVIEECLHRHPDVELAAAIGKPDLYAGELPVAYVSLKKGAKASADELRDFARAGISERAAAPADIVILDAMPVTAVGKIFKPALRRDAIEKAYTVALGFLADQGLAVDVSAGAHQSKGTLALITVTGLTADRRADAGAAISDALGGFAAPFEIVWA